MRVNLDGFRNEARKIASDGITREGFDMMMKIGGLARALYIILAIVAGFMALSMMNVPLVLVVLGLVAGLAMTRENMVLAAVTVVVLPMIGAALANIPAIGAQLTAVCGNLQLGAAGSFATALAIFLYGLVMDSLMGMTGADAPKRRKAAA